jgi:hypothetical protein
MAAGGIRSFDLVMTLLVRDEEDIIAANIDYHRSQGVDFFIVMDNLSTDGTAEILKSYERMGILHYILQPDDDYSQGRWVTAMARMASVRYGAKWVINNDADEFWWPVRDGYLRELLLNMPEAYNVVEARRHNFVPVTDASNVFYESMIYRQSDSVNPLGQPLSPKVCHRGLEDVVVDQGNHRVSGFEPLNVYPQGIEILHFPFRTLRQYENKIIKGGEAYRRNTELHPETGCTWRRMYETYRRQGRLPDHVRSQIKHAVEIEKELRNGFIVEDQRLRNYMARIRSRRLEPVRFT